MSFRADPYDLINRSDLYHTADYFQWRRILVLREKQSADVETSHFTIFFTELILFLIEPNTTTVLSSQSPLQTLQCF